MADTDDFPTRSSLLRQLRSLDNATAWKEFLDGYKGLIAGWCRRHKLRKDQVEVMVAQIYAKLVTAMPRFTYDRGKGRFRDWLRKLVRNEVSEYWRRLQRTPGAEGRGGDEKECLLAQLPDPTSIDELSDELYDRFCRDLAAAERIMGAVKKRVEPQTWEAYWLTAIEGLAACEAARRLNMSITAVSQAKHRVGRMLQEELDKQRHSERDGGRPS